MAELDPIFDRFPPAITLGRAVLSLAISCDPVNSMTSEQELWACALQVEKLFGEDGPRHVAERIGALALQGDEAGVATWKSIAVRLDQIRDMQLIH